MERKSTARRRRSSEESVAIATPGYQLAFWLAHETSRGGRARLDEVLTRLRRTESDERGGSQTGREKGARGERVGETERGDIGSRCLEREAQRGRERHGAAEWRGGVVGEKG